MGDENADVNSTDSFLQTPHDLLPFQLFVLPTKTTMTTQPSQSRPHLTQSSIIPPFPPSSISPPLNHLPTPQSYPHPSIISPPLNHPPLPPFNHLPTPQSSPPSPLQSSPHPSIISPPLNHPPPFNHLPPPPPFEPSKAPS